MKPNDGQTLHDVTEGHTPFPWIVREPPRRASSFSMPPIVQAPPQPGTAYGVELLAEDYGDDPGHERKRADCHLVAIACPMFRPMLEQLRKLLKAADVSTCDSGACMDARELIESIEAQLYRP